MMYTLLIRGCSSFRVSSMPSYKICTRLYAAVSSSPSSDSVQQSEMTRALEYAKLMDKKYGLCTQPSLEAWNVVDEVFKKIQCQQDTEADGCDVQRRPSMQNTRRKKVVLSSSGTMPGRDVIKGRRYFF